MQMSIAKLEKINYNANYKTKHAKTTPKNQQRCGCSTQILLEFS